MEKILLGQNFTKPVVLCLGFFDSMHLGHVALLNRAKQLAKERGAAVALFTFSNSHFEALKRPTKLIYTFDERLVVYQSLGVDVVVYAQFDNDFMAQTGEEFLRLVQNFNLLGVVCGDDYTCGSDLLSARELSAKLSGVPVEIVETVKQNGQKVCSTLVRNLLLENAVERANSLLSEPFFFCGKVEKGRHVGTILGFPTANLQIPAEKICPAGVYGGEVTADGKKYLAVVNVGAQPTFGEQLQLVEAHLLDFDGNLYGKTIKVALKTFLRSVQTFESGDALKNQLEIDVATLRKQRKNRY